MWLIRTAQNARFWHHLSTFRLDDQYEMIWCFKSHKILRNLWFSTRRYWPIRLGRTHQCATRNQRTKLCFIDCSIHGKSASIVVCSFPNRLDFSLLGKSEQVFLLRIYIAWKERTVTHSDRTLMETIAASSCWFSLEFQIGIRHFFTKSVLCAIKRLEITWLLPDIVTFMWMWKLRDVFLLCSTLTFATA